MIAPMFTFRPLQKTDVKLLHRWRNQPHVAPWWDGPDDLAGIRAHYEPYLASDYPVRLYIAARDGIPFGRIQVEQTCNWLGCFGPEVANIDFLIGRTKDTGEGLGPRMIDEFLSTIVFADPRFDQVISDPVAGNTRSIRALEKAGFMRLALREVEGETYQFMSRMKA